MYRAVLDTCVLVPGLQRDFLLQLAVEGAYRPLWGSGVLVELDYVLGRIDAKRGRDGSDERRQHLVRSMRSAFPGAEVHAPKGRRYDYDLDDPDDGHVAHAAIIGKADGIVTDDARAGFTGSTVLTEAGIDVVRPREFAAATVLVRPDLGVRALVAVSQRLVAPRQRPVQILEELRLRYGMVGVAETLGPHLRRGGLESTPS